MNSKLRACRNFLEPILLLAQRGKLRLTDKLSQYLSGYPAWADQIEVGQLLNYTSGLPEIPDGTEDAARQAVLAVKTLSFAAGSAYLYSYANVIVQKQIVEKVAGVPYDAFLSSQILTPCGVTAAVTPKWTMPFTNSFKAVDFDPAANRSASFTAKDLQSWMGCLASGKVLNAASVRRMGQSFGAGESSLGAASFEGDALVMHQHQGSGFNYEALIFSDAKDDTSMVLLTNNQNFKLFALKDAIMAILHGQAYTVPKKSIYLDIREGLAENFETGMAQYMRLRQEERDKYDFQSEPMDLISAGKYLSRRNKLDEAIAMFDLSATFPLQAPDLSYAYELLGETWLKRKVKPLAKFYYQKAVDTDAGNKNARGMLESLKIPVQ